MYDLLFIEMFDETEPPTRGMPAEFPLLPLDRDMFPFEKSTGAAELLAIQLENRHLAEELLGVETFSKRVTQGLFDLTPSAVRPPIDTNSYQQDPLPEPSEMDENPVELCTCSCPECRSQKCGRCSATEKCKFHPSRSATPHKAAIHQIVREAKDNFPAFGKSHAARDRAWQGVELALLEYVSTAVASAGRF